MSCAHFETRRKFFVILSVRFKNNCSVKMLVDFMMESSDASEGKFVSVVVLLRIDVQSVSFSRNFDIDSQKKKTTLQNLQKCVPLSSETFLSVSHPSESSVKPEGKPQVLTVKHTHSTHFQTPALRQTPRHR